MKKACSKKNDFFGVFKPQNLFPTNRKIGFFAGAGLCWTFFLTILSGCTGTQDRLTNDQYGFTQKVTLSSEKLASSNLINKASSLHLFGNYLFVYDWGQEYQYKVIDITSDRLIREFAKNGEGPCEVGMPTSLNWLDKNRNLIGINDRRRFKMQRFELTHLTEPSDDNCQELPVKLNINFQRVVQLDSTAFLGYGLFQGRYALQLLGSDKVIESTIGFPQDEDQQNADYQVLAMAYQGDLLKHPVEKKVVSTSTDSFSLDIIELKPDKEVSLIKRIQHWAPDYKGVSGEIISADMISGNRHGAIGAAVSNDFIYLLFSGKSNEDETAFQSDRVFVYDWEGNPIKILSLDHYVSAIAVDEADQVLVGFLDARDPALLKYDLGK